MASCCQSACPTGPCFNLVARLPPNNASPRTSCTIAAALRTARPPAATWPAQSQQQVPQGFMQRRRGVVVCAATSADVAEQRRAGKQELLQSIAPLERGAAASPADKHRVEELVRGLEALNPNLEPLTSPLINGKWRLVYTTSDSILGTNRPKFLRPNGDIYQCIDTGVMRAQNIETWPFFNQVRAKLTAASSSEVKVKFEEFKILGVIPIKAPDSARGELDTTYLDEEMRISRGNRGNLFVLIMEDRDYKLG